MSSISSLHKMFFVVSVRNENCLATSKINGECFFTSARANFTSLVFPVIGDMFGNFPQRMEIFEGSISSFVMNHCAWLSNLTSALKQQ
jgi:hypothetical protein